MKQNCQILIEGVVPNQTQVYNLCLDMSFLDFKNYIYSKYKISPHFYNLTINGKNIYNNYSTFKEFNEINEEYKIKKGDINIFRIQIKGIKEQLEKEIDEQNCPIMSRINEHRQNIILSEQKRRRVGNY